MSDFKGQDAALTAKVKAIIAASAFSSVPVLEDNVDPGSVDEILFVVFKVRRSDRFTTAAGDTPPKRTTGRMVHELYARAGSDSDQLSELAGVLADGWEAVNEAASMPPYTFDPANLIGGFQSTIFEGYWNENLIVTFDRDET